MVTTRQAQTGNRVYGGVSQSPNRGQVSAKGAQGYLQRELRNRNQGGVVRPVGKDGKSDSRSGVAAAALGRNFGGRPQTNQGAKKNPMLQNQPQNPNAVNTNQIGTTVVPQIKVNDQGMLELPYSQNLSLSAVQAVQGTNEELTALQLEEQQALQQAAAMRREADTQYGQLKEETLGANASNGTAFSSAYAKAVGDNATAYSKTLSDISMQESTFAQNASARRAAIQSALAQQLAAAAQEEAAGMEDWGEYGFDTSAPAEAHAHQPNPGKGKGKKPAGSGKANNDDNHNGNKDHGGPVKKDHGGPVKKGKK